MTAEIFPTATEARFISKNWALINAEGAAIQAAVLSAAQQGFYNTTVSGTTMTSAAQYSPISMSVDTMTNIVTTGIAHGYTTGDAVQFTTDGTLPTPLLSITNYYVIVLGPTTLQLAPTKVDAVNNTNAIAFANAGNGNIFITKQSPAQVYYDVFKNAVVDQVLSDQMTTIINYFTNLGYAITQVVNTTTNNTFVWSIKW